MATVSFKKPGAGMKVETAAPVAAPTAPVLGVATVTPATTAVAAPAVRSTQLEGEFTAADAALPYLSLCQKSGKMFDEHSDWLGQFVYDKSLPLGQEITVVFAHMKKYYEEALEYESKEIPERWDTRAQASESGKDYREVGVVDLLIVTDDEKLAEYASHISGDKAFVPVRMTCRSTSYGTVVSILVKDLGQWLKGDLLSGYYTMSAEKRVGKKNSYFAPVLKTAGKVEPALVAELHQKFGV